jgi:DNA-binding HxlR family transcriptional regulator
MSCPVEGLLELIWGKWKVSILWWLQQRTMRFTELHRALPGITQKMLTQQLRELERHGLVSRKVYPEVPPKVEYSITDFGASLKEVLDHLGEWAENNSGEIKKAIRKSEQANKKTPKKT